MRPIRYFVFFLLLAGCAPHVVTTSTQTGKYSEDLSTVRPKVEVQPEEIIQSPNERKQTPYVEPVYAVNKQLDEVLDSISSINLSRKYVEGYTIQVYSGTKKEEALNLMKQLYISFPEIQSEMQFQQPNFRVKAGKYFEQLDAQKDYMALKHSFPNAIIIPDKIAMN